MTRYRILPVALVVVLLAVFMQSRGEVADSALIEYREPDGEPKYRMAPLPISEQSAMTWIVLNETVVTTLPDQATLGEIIRAIKSATKTSDKNKGVKITLYLNPIALLESEITLNTPIKSPYPKQTKRSLAKYLEQILKPLGLGYQVHDNIVVIDSPCCDCPGPRRVRTPEAETWLTLHRKTSFSFPEPVSLRKLIELISKRTKTQTSRGLVFRFTPGSLRAAKKSMDSTLSIELEDVPLCTALGFSLNQISLGFYVRQDGVVVISSPLNSSNESLYIDSTDVADAYQTTRYVEFWERQ